MMIRILSVLPAVMGVICALLVVVSLYGPTLDASRTDIPLARAPTMRRDVRSG